jgi:hypothetical protein
MMQVLTDVQVAEWKIRRVVAVIEALLAAKIPPDDILLAVLGILRSVEQGRTVS